MDPTFVQNLHHLLVQTTANNTAALKAATAQLNQEFYKNPACIPALASILASSPEQSIRQLAAVELRKRISQNDNKLWTQLPQNEREEIKSKLPDLVLVEPAEIVRHSAARVVSAIASIEVSEGNWPNLLPFLVQKCSSPTVSDREASSFILFTILESVVDDFHNSLLQLFQILAHLISDPESINVRIVTVRALGEIAQLIDIGDKPELNAYQELVPLMIQVVGQTVELGNETGARQLFDVIESLLILEVPVLGKHIPQLVNFLLLVGANHSVDPELRVLSLNALNWTVQYKKSKLQSLNLAPAILEGLMPVTTEAEPEDIDDDAPSRSALRIVDGLATNLPPSQVFPSLSTLILQFYQSPDATQRRGAMLSLGMAVEGCTEFMSSRMEHVWPLIEAGLQDGDASVRKAACVAVGCLCESLDEQCAAKHAVLIPAIMNLINDPITQRSACTALDALLEILQDSIDQYLPLIMDRLALLLDSAPLNVKAVVAGAIGSASHASKANFLPYFDPTIKRLAPFLVLTGEGEETELRGIAMDAIGTFAEAVGKDIFRPYFADMMRHAFEGLKMESARLHECSFLFFGVMARVFGEEFAPYLNDVVPPLLASCKQHEKGEDPLQISLSEATSAFSSGSSPVHAHNSGDDVSESIDVEDLDLDKLMDVNSAIAVEKEIAADTIGTIFAATQAHFLGFVEQSTLELVALLPHYYEGIRKSATDSLLEIVRTFYDLSDHQDWVPGSRSPALEPRVNELITHCVPPILEMYDTEDNKSVVASLCIGFAETTTKIGPRFVSNYYEKICAIAMQVLEQKAFCQQDPDQDEDEEAPEDQAEYDSVLISSASDLVASLANAYGAEFARACETFLPVVTKYYKKGRSLSDRSTAIGCVAEIIDGMKGAITPHTDALLNLLDRALKDEEHEVLSNAAFAIGLLMEHSTADLSQHLGQILQVLHPLFIIPPNPNTAQQNAKDNAAGAVGRLIIRYAKFIPLDQVLPIFLGALPLKDRLENRPVFRALFHLFETNGALLFPYLDQLLPVFAFVLDPAKDQLGDGIRTQLIQLIGLIFQEAPSRVQAAGLSPYLPGA